MVHRTLRRPNRPARWPIHRTQQDEPGGEQPRQRRIAEQRGEALHRRGEAQRPRDEMPGSGQTADEHAGRDAADDAHGGDADAPAEIAREHPRDQAPAQAARRIAADVEAHAEPHRVRMHLLGEISHGHGGQTAEREAQQRPQHQKVRPAGSRRRQQHHQSGTRQRHAHEGFAPQGVRHGAGEQHGDRDRGAGEGQRQRALRGADAELSAEFGHQRLHAVQQPERGHAGREQAEVGAPEVRRAVADQVLPRAGARRGVHGAPHTAASRAAASSLASTDTRR